MTDFSAHRGADHRFGAVSHRLGRGTLVGMTEPQPNSRVSDDSAAEPSDEPRTQTASLPAARLLANPRRIRRA